MMKRIVLSILSLVMAFVAMANPVGVEQARKVGASWLSSRGHYGAVKLAVVESPFADIYDMLGRHMTSTSSHLSPFTIHLPSGVYLVRVGDRPARKVVVLQ